MRFLEELHELLAEAGLGWVPAHLVDANCAGPFQVRVLFFNSTQFLTWLSTLSKRLGLPAPRQLDFICGSKLESRRSCMDSAFLFNLEGLTQLKNLIQAAFEWGEPYGFMALEP